MNIIFIGNRFYKESGTMMSSIYQQIDGVLHRTDWGFVNIALENGEDINIRQATSFELGWADEKLKSIQEMMTK